jgi:hypothetical protein
VFVVGLCYEYLGLSALFCFLELYVCMSIAVVLVQSFLRWIFCGVGREIVSVEKCDYCILLSLSCVEFGVIICPVV